MSKRIRALGESPELYAAPPGPRTDTRSSRKAKARKAALPSGTITPEEGVRMPRDEVNWDDHGDRDPNHRYSATQPAAVPYVKTIA